ncbi:MAG: DUF4080 domain-containing protein [Nannocystaceae bacterium]
MPAIVLTTLNARYAHCAFGLRYLHANLGPLADAAVIQEHTIESRPVDVVEALLAASPAIVGLGVYVWNATESLAVVGLLRRVAPTVCIVLGGPEVSHETESQAIVGLADYVIRGEADLAFAELCRRVLAGQRPLLKIVDAPPPPLDGLALPYDRYDDHDLQSRTVYVESTRGCPFRCEFCLSSLDERVRAFPAPAFFAALEALWARGLRRYKFIDRTFNLGLRHSLAILDFFVSRIEDTLFLHFEVIPDRLPAPLLEALARFPPGVIQLEVGVQSYDPATMATIQRRQDPDQVDANLAALRRSTGVHVHADLIVGLPGEDEASFAAGFDRLVRAGPQEIQVGILKRLRGTPIAAREREYGLVFSPDPPYEVLATGAIDFMTMQRLRRFALLWDRLANRGNFVATLPLLWGEGSPYAAMMGLLGAIWPRIDVARGVALDRLAEAVFRHLTENLGHSPAIVAATLAADLLPGGRKVPRFLREAGITTSADADAPRSALPERQARHVARRAADEPAPGTSA